MDHLFLGLFPGIPLSPGRCIHPFIPGIPRPIRGATADHPILKISEQWCHEPGPREYRFEGNEQEVVERRGVKTCIKGQLSPARPLCRSSAICQMRLWCLSLGSKAFPHGHELPGLLGRILLRDSFMGSSRVVHGTVSFHANLGLQRACFPPFFT